MEDFRAHLRAAHRIRDFNTAQDLPLYEAWQGSARYVQRRPPSNVNARLRQPILAPANVPPTLQLSSDFSAMITRSVSEGIERGMLAVMEAVNAPGGNLSISLMGKNSNSLEFKVVVCVLLVVEVYESQSTTH